MTKIKMSERVKEKLEAERQEKNKVRIFDLMTRISLMGNAGIPGVGPVAFSVTLGERTDLKPGFAVHLKCYDSREDLSGKYLECIYFIDSEEWEFEVLEDYLEQLQWRADEAKRKHDKRDAELRKLSPESREALGFGNWLDPQKIKRGLSEK